MARDVATVASGVAGAQVITLVFTPFITRLYGPEAFGVLAAFNAVLNIVTPIATFGYANAIVMATTQASAFAIARLSLSVAIATFPLGALIVWICTPYLSHSTVLAAMPHYLYLVPATIPIIGLLSISNQLAIREGLFRLKSTAYVESSLLMNISKLLIGLCFPSGLSLILMAIFGRILNYLLLFKQTAARDLFDIRRWIGAHGMSQAAKEYKDFAMYRMPQSIVNAIAFGLPVILLTKFFGAASAGQYSLAVLVLAAPITLLGNSVSEVFFPEVTRAIRRETCSAYPLIARATLLMGVIALVPFGLLGWFSDLLFPYAFGEQWSKAGQFAMSISLWMASVLVTRPAVAAMPVLRLQGLLLVYEIGITLLRVFALVVGVELGDDITAIKLFVLTNISGQLFLLFVVLLRASKLTRTSVDV